jgi:hypothetical protein
MKRSRFTFIIIIAAIAGFFSYRFIVRVTQFLKLSQTLPEYLRDMIGVKPHVSCSMRVPGKYELKIGLKKDILEREKDLKEVVENYIKDFYPELSTDRLEIKLYELPEKSDGKKEE